MGWELRKAQARSTQASLIGAERRSLEARLAALDRSTGLRE